MLLEINELSKKYTTPDGEVIALDKLSLKVNRGEFVAIVGKSGSGKTSLINMIGGLDLPDGGTIMLDGVDTLKLSERKRALLRRQKIGIIYQFYNLIPELTVSENITLPKELSGEEIDREWLTEILLRVGLSERASAYPAALSGGQQQRAAIARALFNKPSLILADEPTGNLDSESGAEILSLLKYMNEELGATLIAVTHSESLAGMAKRVVTISNGKVTSDRRQ